MAKKRRKNFKPNGLAGTPREHQDALAQLQTWYASWRASNPGLTPCSKNGVDRLTTWSEVLGEAKVHLRGVMHPDDHPLVQGPQWFRFAETQLRTAKENFIDRCLIERK